MEDYLIQMFNDGSMLRVTHKETGVQRVAPAYVGESAQIAQMMDEIENEIAAPPATVSFAEALQAVVADGKGMRLDNDKCVVRAKHPDMGNPYGSDMDLPYLYITTEVGRVPWTIDPSAVFATWVIVE